MSAKSQKSALILALTKALNGLSSQKMEVQKEAALSILLPALKDGEANIRHRFIQRGRKRQKDHAAVYRRSQFIDMLLIALFEAANKALWQEKAKFSLIAVGGYGRGELAPFSDIDILFLQNEHAHDNINNSNDDDTRIEFMLYCLWDMGFKIGHAVRNIKTCIKEACTDDMIATNLSERRFLAGDYEHYKKFDNTVIRDIFSTDKGCWSPKKFIVAKLNERAQRHAKQGETRFLLEPNIKESKGGLRDLHCLYWISASLYKGTKLKGLVKADILTLEEYKTCLRAEHFLLTVRCCLHELTDRAEERLSFDTQPLIAKKLGYKEDNKKYNPIDSMPAISGVEHFMRDYFTHANNIGTITRIILANLEAEYIPPPPKGFLTGFLPSSLKNKFSVGNFTIINDRITINEPSHFERYPQDIIRLFLISQEKNIEPHPNAMRALRKEKHYIRQKLRYDIEANQLFLKILQNKGNLELTLRRMNEAGLLENFIPDFARIKSMMQYDMYHVYTVDEHIIRTLGFLNRLSHGEKINNDDPLFYAQEIIGQLKDKLPLYMALFFHDIAKGRGGDHAKLGAKALALESKRFELEKQQEELASWLIKNHLLMSATIDKRDLEDPKTITDFCGKVKSLQRLKYLFAMTAIDISAVGPNRFTNWKATLLHQLYQKSTAHISGAENTNFSLDSKSIFFEIEHIDSENKGFQIKWLDGELGETYHLAIKCPDKKGLFARLMAAIAMSSLNITDARIYTMENGEIFDIFAFDDIGKKQLEDIGKRERLEKHIEKSLNNPKRLKTTDIIKEYTPKREAGFIVEPEVNIDNISSANHSLIEVIARDRMGLLYDITNNITDLGLDISTAKISTYGSRAVDVFYVKDKYGEKIMGKFTQKTICGTILECL